MQVMPVALGIVESVFLNEDFLALNIFHHFLYRDMVVSNGRRFAIAPDAHEFELNHQRGLMRFSAFRNGKGMTKWEAVCLVPEFHAGWQEYLR